MINKPKTQKLIIQLHTFLSLVISVLVYFFYEPSFAKVFFYGSLVLNLYLRLLGFNFLAFAIPEQETGELGKYNTLLAIFSSLRTALVAGVFALFILKFKFNLYALGASFILFQVILIGSGIFFNGPYNNRDSR
jgi:hypothetical protein